MHVSYIRNIVVINFQTSATSPIILSIISLIKNTSILCEYSFSCSCDFIVHTIHFFDISTLYVGAVGIMVVQLYDIVMIIQFYIVIQYDHTVTVYCYDYAV